MRQGGGEKICIMVGSVTSEELIVDIGLRQVIAQFERVLFNIQSRVTAETNRCHPVLMQQ